MDNIEHVLEKIFTIVDSISKSHGNINTFMRVTEEKMPDGRDVKEIKQSIGRSDESLVSLIRQLHVLRDLVDPVLQTNQKIIELRGMCPDNCTGINEIRTTVTAIDSSIADLEKLLTENKGVTEKALKILDSVRTWSMVKLPTVMGIILLIFLGINYFFLFDKVTDWTSSYMKKATNIITKDLDGIKARAQETDDFLERLGAKFDLPFTPKEPKK